MTPGMLSNTTSTIMTTNTDAAMKTSKLRPHLFALVVVFTANLVDQQNPSLQPTPNLTIIV